MKFKDAHYQDAPLLICNVWDVASTKVAEDQHFQAIGTSSAAIAAMLGYNDGEEISFAELEYIVKRIAANTTLPLSVDIEAGYSRNPREIAEHIRRLADLGVAGINIEDSRVEKDKVRRLLDAELFAQTIATVKNQLAKDNAGIFLNARTDTFLLPGVANPLEETKKRIRLYENAGADGVFIPGIIQESAIKTAVESTSLPVNVMCMPNLPDFDRLKALGVKRISMGNFLFNNIVSNFAHRLSQISDAQSFKSFF